MRLVLFGVGNLLGEILDCALALELIPSHVVMNVPEVVRPRTRSVNDRTRLLPEPPQIIQLEDFSPQQGECYFLGTTAPDRRRLVEDIESRFGITWRTLVHPAAYVSSSADLAEGVFVGAGSIIGAGARLDRHVFINRKVSVGHDTLIESYARVLGGCNLGGHVRVGEGATIGMGANIIEELEIGREAYVAAGAVVIEDVPARVLVAGVPAEFKKTL